MIKQLPDYNAPSALSALLRGCGFGMQKKFGQNFLINEHIRRELVEVLHITPQETVWEVGPGLGAMTTLLLEKKANLTVFEIDRGFIQLLKDFFASNPHFTLIEGDVLKNWYTAYQQQKPSVFFGNLPYNIAAKLIAASIEAQCFFDRMAITVQKEVGMRMTAQPHSADYSSFSVLCQWGYNITPIRTIAPAAFWPRPNVESQAVLLTRKPQQPVQNPQLLMSLVRSLFAARRKTLKNNLTAFLSSRGHIDNSAQMLLNAAGISADARAETLSIYDFIRLSDILSQNL